MEIKNILAKVRQKTGLLAANNRLMRQLLFNQKKYVLEQNILYRSDLGVSKEKYCDHDIIVSLTTYDKRIWEVHLAIESIMEQTMKANRIILWLDYSFQSKVLPKALQLLEKRGLEIAYCADIRSYKKLVPTLKKYPEDAIITIDDDLVYEFDCFEKLITAYLEDPSYIYCNRQHRMRLDANGMLLPYMQWEWESENMEADIRNFPTTGAGTLFPPHSFDDEVFNETVFMDICKYADDVWFKAMSMKKGTLSKKVYTHSNDSKDFLVVENVQDIGLAKINTQADCLNDKQIKAVFNRYNLWEKLG